jgi:hypothetical protein
MIRFLDGPAEGKTLELRRAPVLLRVAIDGETVDALDQLSDTPRDTETLYVYRLEGKASSYHLLVRGPKARERGGWWAYAEYVSVPMDEQPDQETLQDTERWREWATDYNTKHPRGTI